MFGDMDNQAHHKVGDKSMSYILFALHFHICANCVTSATGTLGDSLL